MSLLTETALIILPVFLSGITFIAYLRWNKIDFLNFPLDLYQKYNGRRIFGDNKTLKGPLLMSIFTGLYGIIIYDLLGFGGYAQSLPYFLVGLSYSVGELPNSFIKRQFDIAPGRKAFTSPGKTIFYIVDIFDSLIAVGLAYLLSFTVQGTSVVLAILLGGVIHILTDRLMKRLHLKD